MIIRKEVEIDTQDLDLAMCDFDFDVDEIQDAIQYNLTKEEQKRIAVWIMSSRSYKEIQDMFEGILENLSIESAKEIIQNLDNRFLTLEQYRERILQLQRSSK